MLRPGWPRWERFDYVDRDVASSAVLFWAHMVSCDTHEILCFFEDLMSEIEDS